MIIWYGEFSAESHDPSGGIGTGTLPSFTYRLGFVWKLL